MNLSPWLIDLIGGNVSAFDHKALFLFPFLVVKIIIAFFWLSALDLYQQTGNIPLCLILPYLFYLYSNPIHFKH